MGFFGHGVFPQEYMLPVAPTDFRAHADLGGGGYFQDVGSHAVGALTTIFDLRPLEVVSYFDGRDVDLRASVTIRYETGALATIVVLGDAYPDEGEYRSTELTLFAGTRGSYSMDSRTGETIYQRWGSPPERVSEESCPAPSSPVQNFLGVLRGREQPFVSPDAAVLAVRVVEAAYRSAREGKPVCIAPEA
jgi:predicted dehydrogenase